MSKRDFYEVLGVGRDASERDIKKAYKRLAMKFHPDRNQGDQSAADKFKEVKEAYEILTDPQKKAAYDQYGHAAFEQGGGGFGGGGFGGGGADFGDIFGDVFGDIFGGGRRGGGQQRAQRGADLRYNMELSLEEAVRGVSKEIEVPTRLFTVILVMVVARRKALQLKRVVPVMVTVKFRCVKASLLYSRPVLPVTVKARSSKTHVTNVMVKAVSKKLRHLTLRSQLVLILAIAFVCLAKVKQEKWAHQQVTYMYKFT